MAVDKLVDSSQLNSDLTSVANAIRAKSGGSSQLAFPSGFVSEIGNIPSGGSGLITVASGTFTSAGEAGSTSAGQLFFVGKKMPKTSFWFKFKAQAPTEFAYDANYKWAYGAVVIYPDFGHFDLSTIGDSKEMVSDISYDINNSGTVTPTNAGSPIYTMDFVRNATAKNPTIPNNIRVDRRSDGFYIRPYHSNSNYLYPSGVKYDWELVYFGTTPSADIVEVT